MATSETSSGRLRDLLSVTDTALNRLDLPDLLRELLDRVCEVLEADTAAMLLFDRRSGTLHTTAARGLEDEVYQGVRIPIGTGFAGRVAQSLKPVVLDRVDETTVANPILWEKGIRTLCGVPLRTNDGQLIGVLHVGHIDTTGFTESEIALLEVVSDRISGAIQSSRLAAEQSAATLLELSLMPTVLPEVPGLRLAARYVAADRGVGGDWYDAFVSPSGALWLITGDVAGHGLAAAVVMGRLRSSLRAYALLEESPERTLELTDRKVSFFEVGAIATVACAVCPPPYEEVRLTLAGHPPPLLAQPRSGSTYVESPVDPPLGAALGWKRRSCTVPLPPGGLLLMYTDGLVERSGEIIDTGLERLRAAVRSDDPDVVCRSTMHQLVGGRAPTDDIALLAVQREASPRSSPTEGTVSAARSKNRRNAASRSFPSTPASVASARSFAFDVVRDWPVDSEVVALIVTELAANAIWHPKTPFTVQLAHDPPLVRIEVTDDGGGMPVRLAPSTMETHGRGLMLVERLSLAWGVDADGQGKTVWAEVER